MSDIARAIVVRSRVSLWRRLSAWFAVRTLDERSKAELRALVEHERELREAKEREAERLKIIALDVMEENTRYRRQLGLPPRMPVAGPGKAVSR